MTWLDRYQAGDSFRAIAKAAGVHEVTVRRLIHDHGANVRRVGPRGRLDVSDEQIRRLREEDGMSYDGIAAAVGMSRTGVRHRYYRAIGRPRPDRATAPT